MKTEKDDFLLGLKVFLVECGGVGLNVFGDHITYVRSNVIKALLPYGAVRKQTLIVCYVTI